MTPNAPQGLGMWIAFGRALSPGDEEMDMHVAIERCKRAGVKWVALRAGAGGVNDAFLTPSKTSRDENNVHAHHIFQEFIDAGIDVYVWIFAYKATEEEEIEGYRRMFVAGAKGAIINAEFQYQNASALDAMHLVDGIRNAWLLAHGEEATPAFVAHAPPDYLGAGIGFPLSDELVALDSRCDAIMPQVYAWEHDDRGHVFHVERILTGYNRRGYGPDRVWPVGCTYRPKSRGGHPTPEMQNESERVAEDCVAFLEDHLMTSVQAPSLYSLDAITWINGHSDQVINALEAHKIQGVCGE